ncbi:gliding motility-associated C-terminal domain-containing protein [Pontibacter sp. E15-1]|uniref:gliding motility-associated C-terminal domain-containing protein n=1 Tax=Pontibacter sp. E15-1 TaxID=2919918 RepID=UPI001F5011B0|nr:gliding motility-associated C-terminal domain-containing protein [Pontibacter sp. E15-1]MCJ8167380.1 gliding motility-associated C-terminal domain-containing protein [Pontibacter sp. E15-1]
MPKRLLLILLIVLCSLRVSATHIVGGEFELEHLQDYNYRLKLNLYFDVINGSPAALDQFITVNIFSKATNQRIAALDMFIQEQSLVPYTNIDCTVGELVTRKIVYYQSIFLDPAIFNNPSGYYVTWERCCRNNTISNIVAPEDAAQTFYMEFPPVMLDRSPFVNSSPKLFPPLSDYACVGELFYFDFNGVDPDGDSIVYDMVTPLNGYTNRDMPIYTIPPKPAPYPLVRWLPGYGTNTQVQGSPPISIEPNTGLLTMRPFSKGLFVFGIRAQEFRNGKKIGEVRRDFQVLVLECPRNQSPKVVAQEQGKKEFYQEGTVLRISPTDNRCINLFITDPDLSEFVSLRAKPVNFSSQEYTFQGTTSGMINQGPALDSLKATLCFDQCFDTGGKIYELDLIVSDDGCSLPRQDTVRVRFQIEPTPDIPPSISLSTNTRVFKVKDGDQITFDVLGLDPDEDIVSLTAEGEGFTLSEQDISFTGGSATGRVSSPFTWNINCTTLQRDSYTVNFNVESIVCDKPVNRTIAIEVQTESNNNAPTLTSDQPDQLIELETGQTFTANLLGTDLDLDQLTLTAAGEGFTLDDLGISFTSTGGLGQATGVLTWTPTCEAVRRGSVRVKYTLQEQACAPNQNKELVMEFRIKDPNNAPQLTSDKSVLVFDLKLNDEFEAQLSGTDLDLDNLLLSASGDGFTLADYGMSFESTPGKGDVKGVFRMQALCKAAEQGLVRVNFNLAEDACTPLPQQLTMEFRIEVPKIDDHIPANIFTPNGDGKNDFFEVPNLPSEFCTAVFKSIRVYNRWGKEVYANTSSNFKWDGKDVNDGVYFYVIDYQSSKFRGSVTIVR